MSNTPEGWEPNFKDMSINKLLYIPGTIFYSPHFGICMYNDLRELKDKKHVFLDDNREDVLNSN